MSVVVDGTSGITTNSGTVVSTTDATLNGLTVGKGGGSVSTNTAVGASALAGNVAGAQSVALGYQALSTMANDYYNVAVGYQSLKTSNLATNNTAVGALTLQASTTGGSNTALGSQALYSNTTASYNVAVGYQAGYTNSTGLYNTFIGTQAGYTSNVNGNSGNTCVGFQSGYGLTTGIKNTFIGGNANVSAGYYVTTGSSNTIIGGYTGNQGGLDIRTASNFIVLSDGDGNPRAFVNNDGNFVVGDTSANSSRISVKCSTSDSSWNGIWITNSSGQLLFQVRNDGWFRTGLAPVSPYNNTTGNGANMYIATDSSVQRSTSSLKYKTDVVDARFGLADALKLRAVNYKSKNPADGDKVFGGLIAEEVEEAGLNEFVVYAEDGTPDALNYGNMVSLAFKAIQELKALVDAQATLISGQAAEIAELKAKVG